MDTLNWTVSGHCLSLLAKEAKVAFNDLICFALVQNEQPYSQDLVPLNRIFTAFPLGPSTLSAQRALKKSDLAHVLKALVEREGRWRSKRPARSPLPLSTLSITPRICSLSIYNGARSFA